MSMNKSKKKSKKEMANEQADIDVFDNAIGLTDLIMPDIFHEENDYLYFGPNKYARMYSITYPRNMYVGNFNEFFNIGSVDVSTYIENIPDSTVINTLTSKISVLASNVYLQESKGNIPDYAQKQAISDLDTLRESIQTNRDRMFNAQTLVTIWGKNLKKLNENCGYFEDICARIGIRTRVKAVEQLPAYLSSMPYLNIKNADSVKSVTTGGIACLIPTGNTELSHPKGIYLGENAYTQSPIFLDNFIGPPILTNQHMGIFGMAGAGKSVTLKLLAARGAASDRWIIILDPEEEYKQLIKYLGGQYITLKAGEKTGINPFEMEVEEDDKGNKTVDIYGKISEIREMLSMFCEKFRGKPLQGQELTAVEEVIKNMYSRRGIAKDAKSLYEENLTEKDGEYRTGKVKKNLPTLSEMREELDKFEWTKELASMMKIICGDGSLSMFDCETSIDLNSRIIGISLKHLTDEFMKFYSQVNILSWIWAKFGNWKYKDIQKTVIVDEGWMFARYEKSAAFMEEIARRGRKYKISLCICSQMIQEFLSTASGQAIIYQCATKLIMKQDPSIAGEVADFFKLSTRCVDLMSTFPQGYGILKTDQDLVVVKINMFEFEQPYVTT